MGRARPTRTSKPPAKYIFFMFFHYIRQEANLLKIRITISCNRDYQRITTRLLRRLHRNDLLNEHTDIYQRTFTIRSPFMTSTSTITIIARTIHPLRERQPTKVCPTITYSMMVMTSITRIPTISVIPTTVLRQMELPTTHNTTVSSR